jgi:glycosyltransferase involved in cell wall biosynthesis
MAMPSITILIDTFNYGHYIEKAIESVLEQDFPEDQFEIVVVDDGSTDDTAKRVMKYGKRVRYLFKPNGGQASAFNLGIKEANAEIIALLDADDYFLPGKLSRILQEFQRHPNVGMLYHGFLKLEELSGSFEELTVAPLSGSVLESTDIQVRYQPFPTSCLVFRRAVIQQALPVPEGITIQADTYLNLLVPLLTPILAITQPFAVYRVHSANHFYRNRQELTVAHSRKVYERFMMSWNEVEVWTRANAQLFRDLKQVKRFLDRFPITWQIDIYSLDPPGRLRSFWFRIQRNRAHRAIQTWKFTLLKYVGAVSALILGHKRADLIEARFLALLQRQSGKA